MEAKQFDQKDCGLYVLQFFIEKFSWNVPSISELQSQVFYSDNGVSIADLTTVANKYDIQADTYNLSFEQMLQLDKKSFPLAAIINRNNVSHLIVILKITKENLICFDPAQGKVKISYNNFAKSFLNVVISFQKSSKKVTKNQNDELKEGNKIKKLINIPFLLILISETLVSFIFPFVSKYLLNTVIPSRLNSQIIMIALTFFWITTTYLLFKTLIQRQINKILFQKSQKMFLDFLENVSYNRFSLLNKFSNLEIKNRLSLCFNVIQYQTVFWATVINNFVSFAISFFLLWKVNWTLMFILLIYSFLSIIISWINKNLYTNNYYKLLQQNNILDSKINNLLNIYRNNYDIYIEKNTENDFNKEFEQINKFQFEFKTKNTNIMLLNDFLEILAPFIVLIFGSFQIWENQLKIIELIFFLTAANLMTKPIKSILTLWNLHNENNKNLSYLNILNLDEKLKQKNQDKLKLNNKINKITISYLSFKFNKNKLKNTIDITKLEIKDKLIIKGKNGAGKSTLYKLLAGNLKPDSGEILVNDIPFCTYLNTDYKSKIMLITNEDIDLNMAVQDFLDIKNLDEFMIFLKQLPNKYFFDYLETNNILFENISNLSSGQKQILKLLKCYFYETDLFIFDEACEAID
ncbi:Mbov_0121 family peptidase domain-containing ABC transporter [Mycoplasma buteonis]|uniref:Mbov_0121 family peptidase domain-containing ABC transporter n=1 Tax=Mycoplasma buteonis TaxID=171280 RepID=UPI00055ED12D|nr:cysteine peptidase family C39 domain-containing protein [Mycoplasma buteonis]